MRILLIAYCFGSSQGQALIGVYKRVVRVAIPLQELGHEVLILCPGRENFSDALIRKAENRIQFIDVPFETAEYPHSERAEVAFRDSLAELNLDAVVIGEAPLAGALLEGTLSAAELGIPLVCLDNAYQPILADLFHYFHGGVFDGIALTGPSSLHSNVPLRSRLQVAPYMTVDRGAACEFLQRSPEDSSRLLLVLGYDPNVEYLATSILEQLDVAEDSILFISAAPSETRQRLSERLPSQLAERIQIISPPDETLLFGLIQLARLAIVKCAFMQVTECLSLRTPVIGYHYVGDFSVDLLPAVYREFAMTTSTTRADEAVIDAAGRLRNVCSDEMAVIHEGGLDSARETARFVAEIAQRDQSAAGRKSYSSETIFRSDAVKGALLTRHDGNPVTLEKYWVSYLRGAAQSVTFSIVCHYSLDAVTAKSGLSARFWGLCFATEKAAEESRKQVQNDGHEILYFSATERLLIRGDAGQSALPRLECNNDRKVFVPPAILTELRKHYGDEVDRHAEIAGQSD